MNREAVNLLEEFLKMALPESAPFMGSSAAAARRRAERTRGATHSGCPGQVIKMSRGRQYFVAPDGSFRRVAIEVG